MTMKRWQIGMMVFSSLSAATAPVLAQPSGPCPGLLFRQEVEGSDGVGIEGIDGPLVELARILKAAGYPIMFWEPGPSKGQLDAWYAAPCDECAAPPGFDEVDATIEELSTFAAISQGLRAGGVDAALATWYSWMPILYDPAATTDYYDTLEGLVVGDANGIGMQGWKAQLLAIRGMLPACQYDSGGSILNPPCQDAARGFATSDADASDEFALVIGKLDALIGSIEQFRSALPGFYDQVMAALNAMGTPFGGVNPMNYVWKDSRGDHTVQVQVSDFKLPEFRKKTKGNFLKKKICMVLDGIKDDGTNTWVAVRRKDPSANLGVWKWNAWAPGFSDWTLNKRACAAYTPTSVNLATCP